MLEPAPKNKTPTTEGTRHETEIRNLRQFAHEALIESPAHLREAVAQELSATAERYAEEPSPTYHDGSEKMMS